MNPRRGTFSENTPAAVVKSKSRAAMAVVYSTAVGRIEQDHHLLLTLLALRRRRKGPRFSFVCLSSAACLSPLCGRCACGCTYSAYQPTYQHMQGRHICSCGPMESYAACRAGRAAVLVRCEPKSTIGH